jgi:alpha-methylacyl-CoA racemase
VEKNNFLNGVRVLDCTRLLPGPYATVFLADLGAEVIKIEEPTNGDYMRNLFGESSQINPFFQAINRNKKSVVINLKLSEGKQVFLDLVKSADVVVESFRPGVMDKLGIGYKECVEVNPGIIYAAVTGWGQKGPYAHMAGHDINYLGISGLLGLTRSKRENEPVIIGTQFADLNGSWQAVIGILAALFRKYQTGEGSLIDVSMLDGVVSWETLFLIQQIVDEKPFLANEHLLLGNMVCYNIYETLDGKYVTLGCVESKFWKAFCDGVGRPDWYKHQFETIESPFNQEIQALFQRKTRKEWEEIGEKADCCLFPLLDFYEILDHPQISSRQFLMKNKQRDGTSEYGIRFPILFDQPDNEFVNRQHYQVAPTLGQHTKEILTQMGYTTEQINSLQKKFSFK